jgi:uncharacterized protein (TIGR03545 family)
MTNSTVKKKTKKKGPIRIEAIVPITIIILLLALYFTLFFDSHLRRGLEYAATQAHGAEVNVSVVKTSFFEPSITISQIQVTDKSKPEFNFIEIGSIKLKLMWDALLRGKFVIPESSILKIQVQSKRKKPGFILPPPKKSNEKGMVTKAAEKTLDQLKDKNNSNALSDLFSIAGGVNYKDQLKKMESEFKAQEKIKTLGADLKNKEQEWKKRIDSLPDESEIKQLVKKVETLKINTSNPVEIQKSLKEVDSVYKEASEKYKTIEEAKKTFQSDFKKYETEYKLLEQSIKDDISHITEKLNIPSLDPQEINKMLLGNLVASQLGGLMKYKDLARDYMPTKSAQERRAEKQAQELTPTERAKGIDYRFPKAKSYPKFWLQKAQISSQSSEGAAGDLIGTIKNITNNPKHLGLPATFDFKGGFPHQNILDVNGNITVDHTTDIPKEFGSLSVGFFPVTENHLTKSKDVELGYKKADGSSQIKFNLQEGQLTFESNSLFKKIEYYVNATDKNVNRILTGVISGLNDLDLNILAKGSWNNLSLSINSNLGRKIQDAIKNQISGEIEKARKEVEAFVRNKVDGEKAKLNAEITKLEQKLGVSFKNREEAINSVKAAVEQKKNSATKAETKKIEEKGKKELKKLLKGIKF